MDRAEMVRAAIGEAYERRARATVVEDIDGTIVATRYYRKGKRIWCKQACGSIVTESNVYSVNGKPYTRWAGRKWYLTDEHVVAMKNALM